MQRREFISLAGGAVAAWPLAACAQQMKRIGVLMNAAATDTRRQTNLAAFVQALGQNGWVEGQTIRIEVRWNAADAELARTYAAQLIGLMPDAILAVSTTNLVVLRQATNTVPIVFLQVSDPVAQGFVSNLARPGGNITGFSELEFSVGGKCVELLKELVPGLARVAIMFNPATSPQSKYFMNAIEPAAKSFGVQATAMPVRAVADIEAGIESLSRQQNSGLILPTDSFVGSNHTSIAELAARQRVPTIAIGGGNYGFALVGGLMTYGYTNVLEQFLQAAAYVDRILKGAKPGDLPVQLATNYRLAINRKTARALGLEIPAKLLFTADEVIE